MTQPRVTPLDTLRNDILACGHDDFVSMADVQACIYDGLLKDMPTEHRQLVVDAVRSLLEDGLVEVGNIPGRNDPGFDTWPGTNDEVMARFVDCFIGSHDNPYEWRYKIWLNLTAKGQQISSNIVGSEPDSGVD